MAVKYRMIDIARKANVSIGTVDRVINGRGKVAKDTEKQILAILKEFNYQPNLMASSLSSKKHFRFAILLPKPFGEDYWYKIHLGIERTEKAIAGYNVEIIHFLYEQFDDAQFNEFAVQILEGQFDGVLMAPVFYQDTLKFIKNLEFQKTPYVFIDTFIQSVNPICTITQDVFQSGALAAKLLDYCLRESEEILSVNIIANIGNMQHAEERSNGFNQYLKSKSKNNRVIHHLELVNPIYEKLSLLLTEKLKQYPQIKGIFINNSRAHLIARYLTEYNIPSIKLIGYDLIERNIEYLKTGVIDFLLCDNLENQGEMGLNTLYERIVKKKPIPDKIEMPLNIVTKENLAGILHQITE
jgi:LacI family transcriptional regulator